MLLPVKCTLPTVTCYMPPVTFHLPPATSTSQAQNKISLRQMLHSSFALDAVQCSTVYYVERSAVFTGVFLHFFLVLQRLIVTCRRISRISRLRAFSGREQVGGPIRKPALFAQPTWPAPSKEEGRRGGTGGWADQADEEGL